MKKLNWHLYMILLVGVMMWAAVPVTAAAADTDPSPTVSPGPDETPEPPELGQVMGLHREKATKDSVTVTWDEVKEAEKYEIYVSEEVEGEYELLETTDQTQYTIEDMVRGKILYVKVRAVSGELSGADSVILAVAPVPDQVRGVRSIQNVKTKITLQWDAAEGATGYAVYYRPSTGTQYIRAGVTEGLSFQITGLTSAKE